MQSDNGLDIIGFFDPNAKPYGFDSNIPHELVSYTAASGLTEIHREAAAILSAIRVGRMVTFSGGNAAAGRYLQLRPAIWSNGAVDVTGTFFTTHNPGAYRLLRNRGTRLRTTMELRWPPGSLAEPCATATAASSYREDGHAPLYSLPLGSTQRTIAGGGPSLRTQNSSDNILCGAIRKQRRRRIRPTGWLLEPGSFFRVQLVAHLRSTHTALNGSYGRHRLDVPRAER